MSGPVFDRGDREYDEWHEGDRAERPGTIPAKTKRTPEEEAALDALIAYKVSRGFREEEV